MENRNHVLATVMSGVLLAAEALMEADVEETEEFVNKHVTVPFMATVLFGCNKLIHEVSNLSDEEFRKQFRVPKQTYLTLCEKLAKCPTIYPKGTKYGRSPLNVPKQIQILLCMLNSSDALHTLALKYNISQSTVIRVVKRLCEHIVKSLYSEYIVWPTGSDMELAKMRFHQIAGLPGVVGVVDSNHIQVKASSDDPGVYKNKDGRQSVVLQATAIHDMRFSDLFCNSPGRFHDAHVLLDSPLFLNGQRWCGEGHIVGDTAYPLLPWLLTPYEDNGYLSPQQMQYNCSLNATHAVVRRAFSALKGRFRRIKFVDAKDVGDIPKFVMTACIIHNLCILSNDNPCEFIADVEDESCEWQTSRDNDLNGVYKRDRLVSELLNPGFMNAPHSSQPYTMGHQYS